MKLLVYLRDGRTCLALAGRGQLHALTKGEPWHENKGIPVVRGTWNPTTGTYVWRPNVVVRYISHGTIAWVEEGDPNDAWPQA